ncbi:dynactin subunit 4-like [Panonychus citri]|uniref:dynactin subunit 4-like n=1 Tax=Panonychus citri TaxID=50023 RepID=UPI0023071596|nr:dynactin subunit 4-like [Panonychus citri]
MDIINEIFSSNKVLYECSCGHCKPLTHIYFCRYCLKIRCKDCVSHEVDSQYCQHCLEYIPTVDAKLKKNKCASCFQCPVCMHTFTPRTFLASVPSETDPNGMTTRKAQVLLCSYCKWSSKDVGIPDQLVGSGGWPEVEVPNKKRIEGLVEHYRVIAQRERMEKEKKRINPRPGHAIHLLDKYGISASLSAKLTESLRTKAGRTSSNYMPTSKSLTDIKLEPSIATDQLEPLKIEDYYNRDLNEMEISTIEQRLMQIEIQPGPVEKFYPISKMLYVKRSLRCKECDHNLIKPEYNSSSIKFKIQLSAYYDIPEVKIASKPKLYPFSESTVELTFKNPYQYGMNISLHPLNEDEMNETITGKVILPKSEFILECKDDTLELELDSTQKNRYNDDPQLITFRRGNKIGLRLQVSPTIGSGDCRICFRLKHDFVNSVIQTKSTGGSEPQVSWIYHKIYINLGPVIESRESVA